MLKEKPEDKRRVSHHPKNVLPATLVEKTKNVARPFVSAVQVESGLDFPAFNNTDNFLPKRQLCSMFVHASSPCRRMPSVRLRRSGSPCPRSCPMDRSEARGTLGEGRAMSRGVLVAGIAQADVRTRLDRLEMAPQPIENVQSAPENGMAPADPDPQYVVPWRPATVATKHSRRISPDCRRNQRHAGPKCPVSAITSRSEMAYPSAGSR